MLRRLGEQPFFGVLPEAERTRQIEEFARDFPERTAACLADADAICAGTVRLFGQDVALLPETARWNVDWKNGGAFPEVFYRHLDVADPASLAEAKRVWELNRQQFLVPLGKAYWLSRDEKYARRVVAFLESWIAANPPYRGINWKDALELAFRLLSWTWSLRFIAHSAALTPASARVIVASIVSQRDHIERHLSTYSSPNTHLLGEALGLLAIGCAFPDLPRAARGVDRGMRILDEELRRQVADDGSHREKSVYYHAYALEMYLLAQLLGRRSAPALAAGWDQRIEAMAEFLCWLVRPDGSIARFGDDDGGRTLRLSEADYYRPRSLLALSAVLFARGDCKHVAANPCEELFWLLGGEGVRRFLSLPAQPPHERRRRFPDGRIAVIRTGWDEQDLWLACHEHPMGFMTAGHSHAGLLSFELCMGGRPVVVDPGAFTYAMGAGWRDHFREAAAHNVVAIDESAVFEAEAPFRWKSSEAIRVAARETESPSQIRAAYQADGRIPELGEHVRSWTVEAPNRMRIDDELVGRGRHRVSLWLHFPDGAHARVRSASRVDVEWSDARVEIELAGFAAPRSTIFEGSENPRAGWVSPSFDHKVAAPALRIEDDSELPACRTMVLTMHRGAEGRE